MCCVTIKDSVCPQLFNSWQRSKMLNNPMKYFVPYSSQGRKWDTKNTYYSVAYVLLKKNDDATIDAYKENV